ncbi:cytochrome b/b6 domain-containing protein [Jiella mangrovi]|uniref:Cytochrome b/b6 domain-containing protein n=1 Tax=Jiella mangrovi TaxID=2821407 RepID=A0ABS4BG99_9HYPH|nr:cytochrome b/b6 domain-containing protein [Jiella mangrovi]MBP0615774.1 cytochrome b/b6 domain-containing protein [Jiella mangrovi]
MTDTGFGVDGTVQDDVKPAGPAVVYRHRLATRVWHWTNVVTLFIMLMSGLTIFNAHPRLYWGQYGANHDHAWLQIGSADNRGYLRVGEATVDTTGVLGRWTNASGNTVNRAFPYWATIPSSYNLAVARHWHLFFAWIFAAGILLYALWSLFSRHLTRDLLPTRKEIAPAHIIHDVAQHARLRFPKGEAARRYNVLQKLSYCGVLLVLLPAVVLTGLTMSPAMNAAWPFLLEIFGGRQSARSIHFIAATLLVLFILVHVAMVVLAGPINEIRSMITGRYRLPKE